MSGENQLLINGGEAIREIPIYNPPTTRAWAAVLLSGFGLLGFGTVASWSWWKGDNRENSIIATVAAAIFGGGFLTSYATLSGLKPRMVSLDALDRMEGFVPIQELVNTRAEIIDLLEDLADQIGKEKTSEKHFTDTEIQTSLQKVTRAVSSLFAKRSRSTSEDSPVLINRSGKFLEEILLQIEDLNKKLQDRLEIEDTHSLGARILSEREDLGEHFEKWEALDHALRIYTSLQIESHARQFNALVAEAYTSLHKGLAPLAKALNVDLKTCIEGKPYNFYENPGLNKSHHAFSCALKALGEKAECFNRDLEKKDQEVMEYSKQLQAYKEKKNNIKKELLDLKSKIASSNENALELEEVRKEATEATQKVERIQIRLTKKLVEVEDKDQKIEVLESELKSAHKKAKDHKASFEKELENARKLLKEKESEIDFLNLKMKSFEETSSKLELAQTEAKETKEQVASLQKKLENAQTQLVEREREIETLNLKMESFEETSSKLVELKSELELARGEANKAKERVFSLEKKISILKKSFSQLTEIESGFESFRGEAKKATEAVALKDSSSKLVELESELELARKEAKEAKIQAAVLEEKLENAKTQLKVNEREIETLRERVSKTKEKAQVKETKAIKLKGSSKSKEKQVEALQIELNRVNKRKEELKTYYSKAYSRLEEKKKELASLQEVAQEFEERKSEIKVFVRRAVEKIKALEDYESTTSSLPTTYTDLPEHGDPFFELFHSINALIRTIESENSLCESSSTDVTPVNSPAKPKVTSHRGEVSRSAIPFNLKQGESEHEDY